LARPSLVVVTGELSGFNYAKELLPHLLPHFSVYGVFTEPVQGAKLLYDAKKLTAFGLFEAVTKLPQLISAKRKLLSFMERERPAALLLIDFPGFNLSLAKGAKKLGIKVFYFIPPKLWAWGSWRVKKLKESVDRLFLIFPFEEPFYRSYGLNAEFVGNPLVDMVKPELPQGEFRERFGLEGPFFVLMPGSRNQEVYSLLPPMVEVAKRLKVNFVLPLAPTVDARFVKEQVKRASPFIKVIPASYRYSALFYGECGVVASGTASLEAALAGLPHVVVYKLNPLTYYLAKRLVKVPFVSLPNLIAGKEVVPELLQEAVDPDNLTDTFLTLQENGEQVRRLLSAEVSSKLKGGAVETLARRIREELLGE